MINTVGRTDLLDYFEKSGIRSGVELKHFPFIVFVEDGADVEVVIVEDAKTLLDFPDPVKVMAQWGGRFRSDFFRFTVGEFRRHVTIFPPKERQVV